MDSDIQCPISVISRQTAAEKWIVPSARTRLSAEVHIPFRVMGPSRQKNLPASFSAPPAQATGPATIVAAIALAAQSSNRRVSSDIRLPR
jgi:hypothetical protein